MVEINKKARAILPVIIILISLSVFLYFSIKSSGGPDTEFPVDYDDYRCMDCNIIIITIDTLRADRLGSYGYSRNTSPNIDRFAEDGILFTKAYAQASATSHSLGSFMTSKMPSKFSGHKLDYERVTLAEIIKESGYKTAVIVNNPWLKEEQGFNQGFDYYRYEQPLPSDGVNELALDWLEKNGDEKFFLWMHYMETHAPYRSYEEYRYDPGYTGRFKDNFTNIDANKYKNPGLKLTPAELYHINALYDGEVNRVDNSAGNLLNGLKRLGLYNNTVIVITADHGDEFREHGGTGHDHTLYNELIHVPLIIRVPGAEKIRADNQIRLMDVMPTVLDILKLKTNRSFDGVSLLPLLNRDDYNLEVYSKMENHHASIISEDEWKLILKFEPYREWDPVNESKELYDLKVDPGEQNNLVDEYPEIAKELEERLMELQRIKEDEGESLGDIITEKTREELRSLGYVVPPQ